MSKFGISKGGVLDWLDSLKIPGEPCRYRFSTNTDATIFCTCFALFVLDLFGQIKKFSTEEKQSWISYIQSFQNKEFGYFEPETYYHNDRERNRYQLTCFCLSALKILNAKPKFSLKFMEQWRTVDDVRKYLYERSCHKGRGGSGNKAMFLAILLTYEYERTLDSGILAMLQVWFSFHDEHQNRKGFWGSSLGSCYLPGLQNGLHQFIIYFYHKMEVPKLNRIVDVALMCQDRQGFFAPTPGGEACYDYDAIHILVNAYRFSNYRHHEIEKSLENAFAAILQNQNSDGGFCRSKERPESTINIIKHLPFCVSGGNPYLWYYRFKKTASATVRSGNIVTGWTKMGRKWDESNLWDTWFRCLSLAEIANTIELENNFGLDKTNFHRMIGLGFFRKHKQSGKAKALFVKAISN